MAETESRDRSRPPCLEQVTPRSTALPDSHAGHAATTSSAWGSLNVFNARDAYRFVADFSVYVERGWRGKGVGRALLARLIELGREHGYHKLVLSAFPFNAAGMALYETIGLPHGRHLPASRASSTASWVDTIVMEKLL